MTLPAVIIGAGPAGLACARTLAEAGQSVVLLEEGTRAGGQYFRQLPPSYGVAAGTGLLRDQARYEKLAAVLSHPRVSFRNDTTAWGLPDTLTLAYSGEAESGRIRASAIVIATGAQDRPFPLPGWTLPGVISAGGCLNMIKGHGLVPTGRVLVAGNGPLVLVVAASLAAAGATLVGVAEAQPSTRLLPALAHGLVSAPGLVSKGIGYRARILRAGAWFRDGWAVAEAAGDGRLARVRLAPVSANGRPDPQQSEWLEVDTLVLGYGLVPQADFVRVAGCRMRRDPELGGLVPLRSATCETSLPNVYAVGDGAGIGGVELALAEGEIAASAILGGVARGAAARRYRRLDAFRRRLNGAYSPPVPIAAATPDTIVCRCEELRLGDLQSHVRPGGSLGSIKTATRLGMGRCQGRNCLPAAASLLGLDEEQAKYPRMRPPVRPIRLHLLAADRDAGPAREPDEINLTQQG